MAKPKPIVTEQVCDTCELDWDLHPEDPTKDDCIDLLKAPPPANTTNTITVVGRHCACCQHNWWNPPYSDGLPQITYTWFPTTLSVQN